MAATLLSVPHLLSRIGMSMDFEDRVACLLAHRDLAPVMHGYTYESWRVREGCEYAAKAAALLRRKPQLSVLGLTVDDSSVPLTETQAAQLGTVSSRHCTLVVHVTLEGMRGDAGALLSVLRCLRGPTVLLSAHLRFSDALRAVELCDRADVLNIHEQLLSDDDVERLESLALKARRVVFSDNEYLGLTGRRPDVVRALRGMAGHLTVRSGAAFSELATVADAVTCGDSDSLRAAGLRQLIGRLADNRVLKELALSCVDERVLLEEPWGSRLASALREGVTLKLYGPAVESLVLPGFVNVVLAESTCTVLLFAHSLRAKLVATRTVRRVAATATGAAQKRLSVHDVDAGITEQWAEARLAQPHNARLRHLLAVL
jgi:hypothetical protein